MVRCGRTDLSKATQDLVLQKIRSLITGWFEISSILMSDCFCSSTLACICVQIQMWRPVRK